MADQTLPTDPFDQQLERLTGLPGGAHTQPTVVQTVDFYGNSTSWLVQVVKTDEGEHVFLTSVTAGGVLPSGRRSAPIAARFVLPPRVLATVDRQRATVQAKVRRRHGQRLAEQRKAAGVRTTFTAEQRAKALATRRAKAGKK